MCWHVGQIVGWNLAELVINQIAFIMKEFQNCSLEKNTKGSLKYLNIHLIIDNLKDDTIDILASLDYETLYFAYFEIW